ncbi:23S rRNA (adenine2030-N6)-methyltransferase [Faunimonas pinastri]|uniref:Ribosomal RNA large subunit methyltransferase J n=1 Tax=Faunimonas pinastri TaxID=1855383 RepID=A0A1H9AVA1_9HYPH|nr:23S rRNA (adenine(2030)-N(6))-methyltransferase RlmJ [Faunimonas pinastri]SEP80704.1 23S rRNA (adenine2030-N6)-methyltransferase [Faunimonas pinastri]
MNYRHAFHAGNFADVVKHITLARIIEHLKAKPAPFRVLDVHAGIGLYDLTADPAIRTGEWLDGVGRLYRDGTADPDPLTDEAEALLAPWRKTIAAVNDGTHLAHYPGSPEIARWLIRPEDSLVFNELHPDDRPVLTRRYGRDGRVKILEMDAWTALKAQLPPPERRGLLLVDPPYEVADEAKKAVTALADAQRRFATGLTFLWYPVKAQADANALARRVEALAIPKTLRVELTIRRADSTLQLNGTGMILVNPPWRLESELRLLLPLLQKRLADRDARFSGGWRMEWLVGEARTEKD